MPPLMTVKAHLSFIYVSLRLMVWYEDYLWVLQHFNANLKFSLTETGGLFDSNRQIRWLDQSHILQDQPLCDQPNITDQGKSL